MHRLVLVVVAVLVAGCGADTAPAPEAREVRQRVDVIELPAPALEGDMSLEEALAARRSVRRYTRDPLSIDEVAQLLWAAQGVTTAGGKRTAPSAGALYPLEVYLADADGVGRYLPDDHALEPVGDADLRLELEAAALGQEAIGDAPAVFVITAVTARTEARYGDRAERYVTLEAGHAAQNLVLQAVALDLAAVPIGAFDDLEIGRLLRLGDGERPLYVIPVGRPFPDD